MIVYRNEAAAKTPALSTHVFLGLSYEPKYKIPVFPLELTR
jgi:hypothetical protein